MREHADANPGFWVCLPIREICEDLVPTVPVGMPSATLRVVLAGRVRAARFARGLGGDHRAAGRTPAQGASPRRGGTARTGVFTASPPLDGAGEPDRRSRPWEGADASFGKGGQG